MRNINKNKGFTVIELIIVLVIILIISAICVGSCSSIGNYSNGDRLGTITKLSHKGIIWSTWEGELVMGGVKADNNSGGSVANVWEFSVTDSVIAEQIQKAMDSGTVIKLHYNQVLIAKPWNGSTTYYVDKVSTVGGDKK